MQVIDNDKIVFCDIDDTLVLWPENHPDKFPNKSFSQPFDVSVEFLDPYDNSINNLVPYQKHIDLLKKYKGRGYFIIVWSAGGVKWAESVVKTLGLKDYVDLVMTKSLKYIDDLDASKILGERIYLK